MPPLCAKAESPTYGCEDQGLWLASSDAKRDTSRSSRRFGSGMQSRPIFKIRLGMMDTRFAFPQRSPKPQERDRVADHREILGEGRAERLRDVEVPRLADDRRHRRAGIEQGLHVGVRVGGASGATGHAEGGELRVLERDVLHATEEPE